MLETVKQLISNSPDISFTEYYQQYVMDIQDYNLCLEVDSLKNPNVLSVTRLVAKLHKELVDGSKIHDSNLVYD